MMEEQIDDEMWIEGGKGPRRSWWDSECEKKRQESQTRLAEVAEKSWPYRHEVRPLIS